MCWICFAVVILTSLTAELESEYCVFKYIIILILYISYLKLFLINGINGKTLYQNCWNNYLTQEYNLMENCECGSLHLTANSNFDSQFLTWIFVLRISVWRLLATYCMLYYRFSPILHDTLVSLIFHLTQNIILFPSTEDNPCTTGCTRKLFA